VSYHSNADLGGRDGYGAVTPEPEGELFHAPWEPRVLSLNLAMGATGLWNIDTMRAARETLPDYGDLSYYEVMLKGLEKLLLQTGAVPAEEPAQGPPQPPLALKAVLRADQVAAALARGTPTSRAKDGAARFKVGQWVRTNVDAPQHHTRLPGYARGKRGRVERVHGAHVFADAHARGLGEQPQWLYTVAFEARELWGATAPAGQCVVSVDAWEPYLTLMDSL
jgi:nitrile hydratase subunit beta